MTAHPLGIRLTGPIVLGLLVGLGVWYFNGALWWAAALALLTAAFAVGWRAMPNLEGPIWPQRPPEANVGGRDEVQVLGWAFAGKRGKVQPRAVDRARAVARSRLALYGLDLDAASDREQIVSLIGKRPYATLHTNVATMPSQNALLGCIDALDALDALVAPDAPAGPRR